MSQNQATTSLPWEKKANRIIESLCHAAWRKANVKPNGTKYQKSRPYTIPEVAEELVICLGMRDRVAAEIRAKQIFLSYDGLQALKKEEK